MNHFISNVLYAVLERWGSDVALSKPVSSHDAVESTDHHEVPDIEFPSFVE